MNEKTVEKIATKTRLIGDCTRIQILESLRDHSRTVNDIADMLGRSQSAASHQLKLFRVQGMVDYHEYQH